MLNKLLSISLLIAPLVARADTAQDYFHRGAQYYIFGDKPKAITEVVTGLEKFPTDQPLQQLSVLLKKEEQKQNQQNQQQQNNSQQQDKDKQQQNSENQQQNKQDQSQQQQNQNNQQDKKDQQQQQQQQQDNEKKQDQDKQGQNPQQQPAGGQQDQQKDSDQKQEAAAMAAGEMTPRQAEQMLDAQKNKELLLPTARNQKGNSTRAKPLRDW